MSQKQQTMKTIIAEKPSVAKEIAHIVGAGKREEGYMQGNGYYVTWAFGHLVQPAMPETYGMKGFHAENLPVIPDPFVLVPRQVKTENGYKPDAGVLAQIKIIGKLFDSSERIMSPPMPDVRESLFSATSMNTSAARSRSTVSGSVRLQIPPSVRDLPTSEMARSMTISIMQPRQEARQTGSSASTARRP